MRVKGFYLINGFCNIGSFVHTGGRIGDLNYNITKSAKNMSRNYLLENWIIEMWF